MVQEAYTLKYFVKEKEADEGSLYLSLFLSQGTCHYAIFNRHSMQLIEMADIHVHDQFVTEQALVDMLAMLVHNQFLDQKKFDKVDICFLNNRFTLIPEAFTEQNDMKGLLSFSSGVDAGFKTAGHKLPYCDFYYATKPEWLDFFGKTFPNANIRHAGAVSIALMFEQQSLNDKDIYLAIHPVQLEIVVKKGKALQFYNVFSYESKEDILYYLLFCMEQWHLNPLLCKMAVAANTETTDDLIRSIRKYVKQVDFVVCDATVLANSRNYQLGQHYYFTVLNQHLCAL